MDDDTKVFGRVMRLPGFDGMIAERGPIHLVSVSYTHLTLPTKRIV